MSELRPGFIEGSLLARLECLADLREHGLILEDALTPLPIVERLDPEDACDLIAVIMRKNCALEILPVLAADRAMPNILFPVNNAAGRDELVKAVRKEGS